MPVAESAQAFVEGFELGAYRFWRYRTGLTDAQKFTVEGVTLFGRAENAGALRPRPRQQPRLRHDTGPAGE